MMVVKNKRGSLPIIALVVLTLLLTISTLFLFQINGKISSQEVAKVSLLEEVYVKEDLARYQIYLVGRGLLEKDSLTKEKFISEFSKREFQEDYLVNLKNVVVKGEFSLDENIFELEKEKWGISNYENGITVRHISQLRVSFKDEDQVFYSKID